MTTRDSLLADVIREHINLTKQLAVQVEKLADSQRRLAEAIQILNERELERLEERLNV